ncbi:hypothetical protein HCH_02367 [Hahella chejuensis KCTC 2396]|uniref:Uncharacterized protein n=1 Tax=Hahella chejuensis (strain KCTC 2396) TaxID=349521 RepID=Q2SJI9_HAHCH|nr:hypothetical protein HCH_02367 [Hahella chejuensis KCTC 2396]
MRKGGPVCLPLYDQLVHRKNLSNVTHSVTLSSLPRQRGIAGVFLWAKPFDESEFPAAFDLEDFTVAQIFTLSEVYNLGCMNALGEGQMLVCAESGDIEIGDYIVTSSRPGIGMRQEDDVLRSYTIAEAREAVNWTEEESDERLISCKYLCG